MNNHFNNMCHLLTRSNAISVAFFYRCLGFILSLLKYSFIYIAIVSRAGRGCAPRPATVLIAFEYPASRGSSLNPQRPTALLYFIGWFYCWIIHTVRIFFDNLCIVSFFFLFSTRQICGDRKSRCGCRRLEFHPLQNCQKY